MDCVSVQISFNFANLLLTLDVNVFSLFSFTRTFAKVRPDQALCFDFQGVHITPQLVFRLNLTCYLQKLISFYLFEEHKSFLLFRIPEVLLHRNGSLFLQRSGV